MARNKFYKKILAVAAILAVFYFVFNFQYTLKHFVFYFWGSAQQEEGKPQAEVKSEPNFLVIENLGIKAPIMFAEKREEKEYQKLLSGGVVHVPGTALPGETGNCFIFGHSSDFFWKPGKYKTVFALLPNIKIGEKIILTDAKGEAHTYRVLESLSVNPDRTDLLAQANNQQKILTLQTSWPLGTALKRWIVRAELQD